CRATRSRPRSSPSSDIAFLRKFAMKPGARWAAIICAGLTGMPAAFAFDVLGIGDMPIRYMTDEDLTIFKAAVIRTLDQSADGVSANWANQNTGAHGTLTPIASFSQ